ncbi:MAG: hypothetical protein ACREEJ_17540 [Ensifer adhaerens]
MALTLIAIHYVPLLLALFWWSSRSVPSNWLNLLADALGIVSILIIFATYPIISDSSPGGTSGNGAGWFLIFSMLTYGLIPLVTISAHVLVGRLLGRAGREGWRLLKQAL